MSNDLPETSTQTALEVGFGESVQQGLDRMKFEVNSIIELINKGQLEDVVNRVEEFIALEKKIVASLTALVFENEINANLFNHEINNMFIETSIFLFKIRLDQNDSNSLSNLKDSLYRVLNFFEIFEKSLDIDEVELAKLYECINLKGCELVIDATKKVSFEEFMYIRTLVHNIVKEVSKKKLDPRNIKIKAIYTLNNDRKIFKVSDNVTNTWPSDAQENVKNPINMHGLSMITLRAREQKGDLVLKDNEPTDCKSIEITIPTHG